MADNLTPLSAMTPGTSGVVAELRLPPESRGRLLEMGLITGTAVELIRFAPMGDPVELKVRGYHLSIRRHEAELILVRLK